jgi:ABC-type transport system substrate-binding protein
MVSCWDRVLQRRLSRRRSLAAGSAATLSAAFLAACGGDDEPNTPQGSANSTGTGASGSSGLLYEPVLTTDKATKGGTWKYFTQSAGEGFDPFTGDDRTFAQTLHVYQRLLGYEAGTVDNLPTGNIVGDAAESWEFTPDKLQVTFHLRKGSRFEPQEPVNGKPVTTADAKASWERFSTLANGSRELVNSRNPDAPILSASFPDNETIVFQLKEPNSTLEALLGYGWYYQIMPAEAGESFDMKQQMHGSGPWMLANFMPSVGYEYARNPNYYRADKVYLDGISYPLITEATQQLAQFKARQVWLLPNNLLQPEVVLPTKEENPQANLHLISAFLNQYSKQDLIADKRRGSVYEDVRLRHAMSMLLDRDGFVTAFGNIDAFEQAGLEVDWGWHSHLPTSWGSSGNWLDPREGKLGDASKYFQFNPEEAQKLMEAAGRYPIETVYTYPGQGGYSTEAFRDQNQAIAGMLQEDGHFKLQINTPDYLSDFNPHYLFGHGQFEGIAPVPYGVWPDVVMGIYAIYMPGGRNDYVGEPVPGAYDLAVAARREFDTGTRNDLVNQWQRAMANEMPTVPFPGQWGTFDLHWPWLANWGAVVPWIGVGAQQDMFPSLWYDKSKDV